MPKQAETTAFDRPLWLWVLFFAFGITTLAFGDYTYIPAIVVLFLLSLWDSKCR